MKSFEGFSSVPDSQIHETIAQGAWTLILSVDNSKKTAYLLELLEDDTVQTALSSFKCFQIENDSELASNLEIEAPASLSVFYESDTPEFSFLLEYPNETEVDDLIQFLDDTVSALEKRQHRSDSEDS